MAEKLPKVCILGAIGVQLYSSPSCPAFETRALDCVCHDSDRELSAILAQHCPDVIVSVGRSEQFVRLNASPAEVRRRWIHFETAEDLARMGAAAFHCFIDNCVRERTDLPPLVSVFTPAHRTGARIRRPYESLRRQTYRNWEWIIVDDSDDDGRTFGMLRALAKNDHRIGVFQHHAHSGVIGKLKSWACRLSSGQILAELDHDDELTPNALADVVAAFRHFDGSSPERPRAGFVSTDFAELYPDGSPVVYGENYALGYGSYRWERWDGRTLAVANTPNINPKTIRHIVGVPNHLRCWHKDLYSEIGGHGRRIHVADDYELILRTFLATRMARVPRLGYLQWRNLPAAGSKGNTHQDRNKEIQRLTRAFCQHYDAAIHRRFAELGIDDFVWQEGGASFLRAQTLPKPAVEQHCSLLFEPRDQSRGVSVPPPALARQPSRSKPSAGDLSSSHATSRSRRREMLRFDIINLLIERNSYQRYLEIGVEGGDAIRAVRCALKHGVDPASEHATFRLPSDVFFASLAARVEYDCIFVDGMHEEEQVLRDIENSLRHLSAGGTIVVHDVNPPSAWHQRDYVEAKLNGCRQWTGTVWRAWVRLRATRPDLRMLMVDTDWGCGIIQRGSQRCIDLPETFTYAQLEQHRAEWLGSISPAEFLGKHLPSRTAPKPRDGGHAAAAESAA